MLLSFILYGLALALLVYIIFDIAKTRKFSTGDAIAILGIIMSILLAPNNVPQIIPPTIISTQSPLTPANQPGVPLDIPTTTKPSTETDIPMNTPRPSFTPVSTFTPTPLPPVLNIRLACGTTYPVETGKIIELHYGGWYAKGLELANNNAKHMTVTLSVDGHQIAGTQQPVHPVTPDTYPGAECTPSRDYTDRFGIFYIAKIGPLASGEHSVEVIYSFDQQITDGGYDSNGNPAFYGPGKLDPHQFTLIARP
jgi:energy-converting hydrogenase Eha subunit F